MNIEEINAEILVLEQSDTNYPNCSKLAILYTIRDHLSHDEKIAEYSYAGSEFLNAFTKAPRELALEVLDEHMEAIKLLHPKEYSAIISKLKS